MCTLVHKQKKFDPAATEIWSPVPKVITAGKSAADAPSDAIVLYNSKKDTANWTGMGSKLFGWKAEEALFTVAPSTGNIHTKKSFGDCQLHLEWKEPVVVKGEGQGRGKAGFFLWAVTNCRYWIVIKHYLFKRANGKHL